MKTSSPAPNAAYQACLDEALRQSVFLIERWCSKLSSALYQRAMTEVDAVQRHQVQSANAALKKNRILIEQGFTGELAKAIALEASGTAPRRAVDSAYSVPSFDELELMKNKQVHLAVESARLQQVVANACQAGFGSFSARLSLAQGFQLVSTKANALRPEVFAGALLQLLQGLDVNSPTRACWLLDGATVMGAELQAFYLSLTHFLAAQAAAPAARLSPASAGEGDGKIAEISHVLQARQPDLPAAGLELETLASKAEPPDTETAHLLTLDNLHRLLVGERDSALEGVSLLTNAPSEQVAHHEFSHTLPSALYVLAELEAQQAGNRAPAMVRLMPSEPMLQMRAHLKKTAKSLGQALAIEVIGAMVEQIANNASLLLPVRQMIADAEPAFLRLAATDPRFFSDKAHPARRLLDTITNSSLGFASEVAPGFPAFMENLRQVAMLLTEQHASDAQHFARLLENFERKQDRHSPAYRQSRQRAEEALLQAELRNIVAVKIAAEIRQLPDFVGVKPVISGFLTGPWAQVMANERRLGASANSGGQTSVNTQTLGDVLWCVTADQASSHHKWLVEIIPGMLKSFREGLLSIDYPLAQAKPFFDEIRACHQRALDSSGEAPAPALPSRSAAREMFVTDEDEQSSVQPWIAPAEAQDSGFMQDIDLPNAAGLSFDPPPQSQAAAAAPSSDLPALVQSTELHLGAWIELLVDARWLRAQLTWVSPRNTLFMFTSNGGRQHSMTARILHHLLDKKFVKIISEQGVLDSALDNIAKTALRNSVDAA